MFLEGNAREVNVGDEVDVDVEVEVD